MDVISMMLFSLMGVMALGLFGFGLWWSDDRRNKNSLVWRHADNGGSIDLGKVDDVAGKKPFYYQYTVFDKLTSSFREIYLWKETKETNKGNGEITYPLTPYTPMYSGTMTSTELYDNSDWASAKRYLTIAKKWQEALKLGVMALTIMGSIFGLMMLLDMLKQG